ncbi:MAG: hypothetical protein RDU20_23400 [Desulfomonilaceae bacterium]|nr:hypothetical protein [Desulfomonilaceae bacterium]
MSRRIRFATSVEPEYAYDKKRLQLLGWLRTTERGSTMKAGIFFTGSGPIVILTSYDSLTDSRLVEKLASKGIKKFIAYEVPVEMAKEKYGNTYNVIMGDLHQEDDLRVLDYDGHHVLLTFELCDLGAPVCYEPK